VLAGNPRQSNLPLNGQASPPQKTGQSSALLPLRFALRELRSGLTGFRIFLACLLLGVAAIASVGTVSQSLLEGLANDGRRILGGDVSLRLTHRSAEPDQLAFLAANAEVSEATTMRAMARLPSGEGRRILVELKAVDDLYPLYGDVGMEPAIPMPEALAKQDGAWGAVVERTLLRRFDAVPGDRIKVGEAEFRIAAVLTREPDRAGRTFTLGPTFMISADALTDTGLVQPGSLIRYHYRLKLTPEWTVPAFRTSLEETFPDAGWRILDASGAAPRISRFINRLTLFLTLVGLASLLVGGVGVGNAVRSFLEQRTPTIATFKCLGAPSRLVFQIYMTQILILAAFGIAGGLLLGSLAPWALDKALGDTLGWSAVVRLYPQALLLAAAFGLLTTVTFSLWPLGKAKLTSPARLFRDVVAGTSQRPETRILLLLFFLGLVLAALAILTATEQRMAFYFIVGTIASFALFRLAGEAVIRLARRARGVRAPGPRLAIANLHRPGAPTVPVIMSLGLGLTLLVAIALIEGNLGRQVRQALPDEAPGFYFIDIQPDQVEDFEATVRSVPGVIEMARVPMLRGRISGVNGVPTRKLSIPPDIKWVFRGDRGLTWRRDPIPDAELTAGDWWPQDYQGEPLVSLDDKVGRLLDIGPGDRLTVNILGRDVDVKIANLRTIDWSDLAINFVMVFSPGLLEAAPQTHIATVRAEAEAEDAIEIAVTNKFVNVSAIRVKEALQQVAELMAQIAIAVRAVAGIAILAGVLVLAGALAAGQQRRIYDAVVLKVLGATRRRIAGAFLLEYGLLGLTTAAIASGIGTLAAYLVLTEVMRSDFVFLPWAVVSTALLATCITLGLGFLGTYRALGHKAAPLLRNE